MDTQQEEYERGIFRLEDIPKHLRKYFVEKPMFDFDAIATQLYRVTKPGGVVVWVVGDATINGSETGSSFRQALGFMEIGFNLHDTMIYAKPGNPAPQNPPVRYSQNSEFMFVFSKLTVNTFNPIMRFGAEVGVRSKTKRNRKGEIKKGFYTSGTGFPESNVWEVYPDHMESGITHKHPATFPEALAHDHIISWSNPGDIVLDPFSGSGTTAKMAKILQRNFIGFDISQEYVDLAKRRIAAAPVPLPLVVESEPVVKAEQLSLVRCD